MLVFKISHITQFNFRYVLDKHCIKDSVIKPLPYFKGKGRKIEVSVYISFHCCIGTKEILY